MAAKLIKCKDGYECPNCGKVLSKKSDFMMDCPNCGKVFLDTKDEEAE